MNNKPSFEDMPMMLLALQQKLVSLETKIETLSKPSHEAPVWFTIKGLCSYLPSHPAEQTVYGWTSCHQIPFHKRGKRIMFLKSEIDDWLHVGKMKSQKELEEEAENFIKSKRKNHFQ